MAGATHTALANLQAKLKEPGQAQNIAFALATGGWLGIVLQHGLPFIVDTVRDWAGPSEPTPEDVAESLAGMIVEPPLDLSAFGVKEG